MWWCGNWLKMRWCWRILCSGVRNWSVRDFLSFRRRTWRIDSSSSRRCLRLVWCWCMCVGMLFLWLCICVFLVCDVVGCSMRVGIICWLEIFGGISEFKFSSRGSVWRRVAICGIICIISIMWCFKRCDMIWILILFLWWCFLILWLKKIVCGDLVSCGCVFKRGFSCSWRSVWFCFFGCLFCICVMCCDVKVLKKWFGCFLCMLFVWWLLKLLSVIFGLFRTVCSRRRCGRADVICLCIFLCFICIWMLCWVINIFCGCDMLLIIWLILIWIIASLIGWWVIWIVKLFIICFRICFSFVNLKFFVDLFCLWRSGI